MRERCLNLDKVVPLVFEIGQFSVGSFGIFSSDSKNKLLENAAEFATLGSFRQLFRSSIFWEEKLNTKTPIKTTTLRHEEYAYPHAARGYA